VAAAFLAIYLVLGGFAQYWFVVVTHHARGDDFDVLLRSYAAASRGEPVYDAHAVGTSFLYHPFALTAVSPFVWLRHPRAAFVVWSVGSILAWAAALWITLGLGRGRRSALWIGVIWFGFGPFLETLYQGQINTFVVLLLCACLRLSERRNDAASGTALALAIVLKTSPVLLVLHFLALRRWRVLAAVSLGVAFLSVVSALQFSPRLLFEYLRVLSTLGSEVHVTPYNHNVVVVAYHLFGLQALVALNTLYRPVVAGLCVVLATGGAVAWRRHSDVSRWLFLAWVALLVVASPLVWYHHPTVLLLPLTLLLLHSRRSLAFAGVVLALLQADRLFEWLVFPAGLPACVAEWALLAGLLVICWKGFQRGFERPVNSARRRSRPESSGRKASAGARQAQLSCARPGMFMRASLPRPSTSCIGTIARRATEAYAARMRTHSMSLPSVPK
jgi:hypothetical protein